MAPRLSGQLLYLVLFSLYSSLSNLGIERQNKLKLFKILTRKPRSRVRILIHRTWPIETRETAGKVMLIDTFSDKKMYRKKQNKAKEW